MVAFLLHTVCANAEHHLWVKSESNVIELFTTAIDVFLFQARVGSCPYQQTLEYIGKACY
jgi:hypothetical protein